VGDLEATAKQRAAPCAGPDSNTPSAPTPTPSPRTRLVGRPWPSVAGPLAVRPVDSRFFLVEALHRDKVWMIRTGRARRAIEMKYDTLAPSDNERRGHVPVMVPPTADSYAGGFSDGMGLPDCIWGMWRIVNGPI
jgi:hypothetical protein